MSEESCSRKRPGESTSQLCAKRKSTDYYGPGGDEPQWGKESDFSTDDALSNSEKPKFKPNFGLSGALAKDEVTGNCVNGVVLKFTEPMDLAMPNHKWRLYVFKDDKLTETLHIHRKSAFLAGRDTRIADLVLAHPSCSKQHAVIQYRKIEKVHVDGSVSASIKPYLMDLASVHRTQLNGEVIDDSRYYELREKDCIKFGASTREYILMCDNDDA